ncbi:phosphodiester glycosidase family protein [Roseimicrobium sp. ORNL1]|uniref:phosphodiester glycosidase family protein n=1 Tax=Roseimicrobium sp. ORNL1 TaxID=2711231 RepID=UPI0013E11EA0|nr:phosphodiester glycosidase family protein [Roseimicrobium sp. ORNL1]QIF01385.1 phosphodiester glycosidase family protein [Roseimicrobium sp. ORNL1]
MTSSTSPISLGHGATVVTKHLAKGDEKCELTLVLFDESQCLLQVASNATKKGARAVAAIAAQAGAIAACNGGYFDPPKMLPSGLEIAGGVRTGTLDLAMPFGGTLLVEGGRGSIIASEKFADHPGISDLIQCCPRLVENGREIKNLGDGPVALRTFILTDGSGRWALGNSGNIKIQELARVLSDPKILSELQVQSALNLDGGPSTALWCKHDTGGQTSSSEVWKVRNVILVSPRKQGG